MRLRLCAFLVAAIVFAAAGPAAATGGLWCKADDANLNFAMRTGLGHGIDAGFLDFVADLAIKVDGIPADFRAVHFDGTGVSQHWLDTREFKLRLYRQRNSSPSGYAVLIVQTTAATEGDYRGQYELSVFAMRSADDSFGQSWNRSGVITCAAE